MKKGLARSEQREVKEVSQCYFDFVNLVHKLSRQRKAAKSCSTTPCQIFLLTYFLQTSSDKLHIVLASHKQRVPRNVAHFPTSEAMNSPCAGPSIAMPFAEPLGFLSSI
jgi:hypothetical protein